MTASRVIFIEVILARAFIEATDHITPGFPGVIVTDVRMHDKGGFDLLERALKIDRDLPVIALRNRSGGIYHNRRIEHAGRFADYRTWCGSLTTDC